MYKIDTDTSLLCRIVDKSILPDGTEIQLEDWNAYNTTDHHAGWQIGAYPIAKKSFGAYCQKGKPFRLTIYSHKDYTDDMLKTDYKALKNGTKTLADLRKHFWNHGRDEMVLGLNDAPTAERHSAYDEREMNIEDEWDLER